MNGCVIVGRRGRVIDPLFRRASTTLDCEWMLANRAAADSMLGRARQIVFTGYLRRPDGQIDHDGSIDLGRLVASAVRNDLSRVLFLGTDAVFSGTKGGYRADDPPVPATAYGRMKLEQEQTLTGACIVRFTVFGPTWGERPLLSDLIAANIPMTLYPNAYFSPVSTFRVNDLLRSHVAGRVEPGIHHLAGDRTSKAALVTAIAGTLGVRLEGTTVTDEATHSDFSLEPGEPPFRTSIQEELSRFARWHTAGTVPSS
jgi:hypothetical protein